LNHPKPPTHSPVTYLKALVPIQSIKKYTGCVKKKKLNVDSSVNITGMDKERMVFCVLHHPMDAKTHIIPPGEYK
jgi:hypothetical protein